MHTFAFRKSFFALAAVVVLSAASSGGTALADNPRDVHLPGAAVVAPPPDAVAPATNLRFATLSPSGFTLNWDWAPAPCGSSAGRCAAEKFIIFEIMARPKYRDAAGERIGMRGPHQSPHAFSGGIRAESVNDRQCYVVVAKAFLSAKSAEKALGGDLSAPLAADLTAPPSNELCLPSSKLKKHPIPLPRPT